MKLTEWFPGDVKPVRKGVYQKMCGHGKELGYQYWDGANWGYWEETPDAAVRERGKAVETEFEEWRGLAEKP